MIHDHMLVHISIYRIIYFCIIYTHLNIKKGVWGWDWDIFIYFYNRRNNKLKKNHN